MNEIDRIKQSNIFSSSFFQAETRCDFLVDEKKKKIWAINLDLLFEFDRICKKYDLKYFLAYGTLLGAIRHKGFVPWDDDIDVCMPRKDYEKLQEKKDEFISPYFLQSPITDPGYYYSYVKIRNSNTTSLSKSFGYERYNQGISIDVFCLDDWDIANGEPIYNKIKDLIQNNSTYMKLKNPNLANDPRVKAYNGDDPMETYERIIKLSRSFEDKYREFLSMPTITVYGYDRDVFYSKDFAKSILWKFEGFEFPIPIGYDRVLKTIYRKYMEFPPVEKRGLWHSALIDPDVPYIEYFSRIDNKEMNW